MAKSTANRNVKIVGAAAKTLAVGSTVMGKSRQTTFLSLLSESLVPEISVDIGGGKALKFWGFGGWAAYRARSALSKEPLTIKWIDGFEDGSVFWDIGANVGVYSLYAAKTKNVKVFAFEPSLMNIATLTRNIELNGLDNAIFPLPVALGEKPFSLDYLHMVTTGAGNTGGQFAGEEHSFRQGTLGYSIDNAVAHLGIPVPDHIKVDVDGIELDILKGADSVLKDKKLKSILLEFTVPSEEYDTAKSLLAGYGFSEDETENTVGERATIRNVLFSR